MSHKNERGVTKEEVEACLEIGFLDGTNFLTLGAIVRKTKGGKETQIHIDEKREKEEQYMGMHEHVNLKTSFVYTRQSKLQHSQVYQAYKLSKCMKTS